MTTSDRKKLELINKLLASCNKTENTCQQLGGCKINVDKELATNREQQEIAQKLKAAFFPNHT